MTTKPCSSGKVRHRRVADAKVAAHAFARTLNRERQIAYSMFAYRCDECRGWHLTRQSGWPGLVKVFQAAPEHLQRWAMGESEPST